MGYNTQLTGSGAQPSAYMGPGQQQGQLAMPARPGMSTYSTPGQAPMNAQQGMPQRPPLLQTWQQQVTGQQGMDQRQRLAAGLSRM